MNSVACKAGFLLLIFFQQAKTTGAWEKDSTVHTLNTEIFVPGKSHKIGQQ